MCPGLLLQHPILANTVQLHLLLSSGFNIPCSLRSGLCVYDSFVAGAVRLDQLVSQWNCLCGSVPSRFILHQRFIQSHMHCAQLLCGRFDSGVAVPIGVILPRPVDADGVQ